jgi:hypothetical protein
LGPQAANPNRNCSVASRLIVSSGPPVATDVNDTEYTLRTESSTRKEESRGGSIFQKPCREKEEELCICRIGTEKETRRHSHFFVKTEAWRIKARPAPSLSPVYFLQRFHNQSFTAITTIMIPSRRRNSGIFS